VKTILVKENCHFNIHVYGTEFRYIVTYISEEHAASIFMVDLRYSNMFLQNFVSYENMGPHNRVDENMNIHHHVNVRFCMGMQFLFLLCVQQNPTNAIGFLDPLCDFFLLPSSEDG